jgi:hypothetical protein
MIESLAGCPKTFNASAIWLVFVEKPSVLVIPILQYYYKISEIQNDFTYKKNSITFSYT